MRMTSGFGSVLVSSFFAVGLWPVWPILGSAGEAGAVSWEAEEA